jgi:hypothetical protein
MGRLERAAAAERNKSSEKLGVILYYIEKMIMLFSA